MTTTELAYHVVEMRNLQKAYFASRNGRYADKKLLAASKLKEKELDEIVDAIIVLDAPVVPESKKQIEVVSFFEQNAIFGNETDCDPYAP